MSSQDVSTDTLIGASTSETEPREVPVEDDEPDSGILNFMTVDEAIELYKQISKKDYTSKLEWKFYGRRKPEEQAELESKIAQCDATIGVSSTEQQEQDSEKNAFDNSEFDFDESFSELQDETSAINDSLQLKKRFEPGSERKTNLSDIMSDIMKETSHTESGEA